MPGCFGVGRRLKDLLSRPKSINRKPRMKSFWHPRYRHYDISPQVPGHFWIRSPERKFLTDAKSGCFFVRWRNNNELSSLPWILYSRWQPRCQVLSRPRSLFYNACSVANFPSGVLGTRVKPDTCQIRVDVETFESGKKKLWIQKHPDACWGGLKLVEEWQRLSRFPTKRTANAWYWEILVLVMSWVC